MRMRSGRIALTAFRYSAEQQHMLARTQKPPTPSVKFFRKMLKKSLVHSKIAQKNAGREPICIQSEASWHSCAVDLRPRSGLAIQQ